MLFRSLRCHSCTQQFPTIFTRTQSSWSNNGNKPFKTSHESPSFMTPIYPLTANPYLQSTPEITPKTPIEDNDHRRLADPHHYYERKVCLQLPSGYHQLQITTLLKEHKLDEFITYMETIDFKGLTIDQLDSSIALFVEQNRLAECWYFIKRLKSWNPNTIETLIDYLDSNELHFYILPILDVYITHYMSRSTSARDSNKTISANLENKVWKLLLNQLINSYDGTQTWRVLTLNLIRLNINRLSTMHYPPQEDFPLLNKGAFQEELQKFAQSKGHFNWFNVRGLYSYKKHPKQETKDAKTVRLNFYHNYLGSNRYKNPVLSPLYFDYENPTFGLIAIAKLFNPHVLTRATLEISRLLSQASNTRDVVSTRNELGAKLLNFEGVSEYHVVPIVHSFIRSKDLIGLLQFINDLEYKTNIRIKFNALSLFVVEMFKDREHFIDRDDIFNQSFEMVVQYLYQETSLNTAVWNNDVQLFLDHEFGLLLRNISFTEKHPLVQIDDTWKVIGKF